MAVPKKRTSSSRRDMRRAHHALTVITHTEVCPHCAEIKLRHRVCPACGQYRGRQVQPVEEAE